MNTGIQDTVYIYLDVLNTGIQDTVFIYIYLDVLNTEIQDSVENKPVFDPDFHTELIIKDEYEDFYSGIVETIKLRVQSF